jgi:hypothetical protein
LPTEETMEKRSKDFTEGKDYDDEQVMIIETSGFLPDCLGTLRWSEKL